MMFQVLPLCGQMEALQTVAGYGLPRARSRQASALALVFALQILVGGPPSNLTISTDLVGLTRR